MKHDDLKASRARFEESLEALRGDAERELGWMPRTARWIVPLVALAVGVVAGVGVRRALPRRRRRRLPG
jgi:hypothetical protein